MSARARVFAVVAGLAAAAAAGVVAFAALTSSEPEGATERAAGLRPGRLPLLLDLGVRRDPEAVALRRASRLLAQGRPEEARAVFDRYGSPEAEIGAAVAAWPRGTTRRLAELVRSRPRLAVARLHLGLARYWERDQAAAVAAWRAAERLEPDSPAAISAEDLLHPQFFRGRPIFVPGFEPPREIASLSPDRQITALAEAAKDGPASARLLYGVALQRLGKPISARRAFSGAAAASPRDPEPQVALAVARFDKDDPARAFSRLGPLARRFPKAPTVRFHLGLLLLWIGDLDEARRQLVLARAAGPRTPIGREANRFLVRLGG